jgi:hypothetical protein
VADLALGARGICAAAFSETLTASYFAFSFLVAVPVMT